MRNPHSNYPRAKWIPHLFRLLSEGTQRFNAIQDKRSGLTPPMLSKRLKNSVVSARYGG